jgi:hypothetical protein
MATEVSTRGKIVERVPPYHPFQQNDATNSSKYVLRHPDFRVTGVNEELMEDLHVTLHD